MFDVLNMSLNKFNLDYCLCSFPLFWIGELFVLVFAVELRFFDDTKLFDALSQIKNDAADDDCDSTCTDANVVNNSRIETKVLAETKGQAKNQLRLSDD